MDTNQAAPDQEEASLSTAVSNLLSDTSYTDVHLQGNDGQPAIPAHRTILAARSAVFRALLFGQFVESSSSVVPIGFHSDVLKAIVEYCYTDNWQYSSEAQFDDTNEFTEAVITQRDAAITKILKLLMAADFFGFPKLAKKIRNSVISNTIEKNVASAWNFLVHFDRVVVSL